MNVLVFTSEASSNKFNLGRCRLEDTVHLVHTIEKVIGHSGFDVVLIDNTTLPPAFIEKAQSEALCSGAQTVGHLIGPHKNKEERQFGKTIVSSFPISAYHDHSEAVNIGTTDFSNSGWDLSSIMEDISDLIANK